MENNRTNKISVKRISENELVLPSLYLMTKNNGIADATMLIKELRRILKPTGEDLEILDRRKDDKFSEKVRNLVSHRKFDRLGYAVYNENTGKIAITKEGKNYLKSSPTALSNVVKKDFLHLHSIADITEVEKVIKKREEKKKVRAERAERIKTEKIKTENKQTENKELNKPLTVTITITIEIK